MTSVYINRAVLPSAVKVHEFYAMEDAVIQCGDTESALPPLDQGTVRKINSSNALVENRLRIYRNQLEKEKDEAKMRYLGKRQDFLRTSFVLQERKRLASRKKSRSTSGNDKGPVSEESTSSIHDHTLSKAEDLTARENGSRSTRENSSVNIDNTSPLRPPFFLPPLHKNIMIDLKDAQERKERQHLTWKWKLNELKLEDLQSCRNLRIAGRARLLFDFKSDENGVFGLKLNNSPSNEDYGKS